MKQFWICCFAILCMALSGCAGNRQEDPPEQEASRQGVQDQEAVVLPREGDLELPAEPDSAPEDNLFSGRWQAAETPQYYMDIAGGDGDSYTIEITWSGASRGNVVWQATGSYDETWEGVAYVGAKYEDVVKEDGTIDRIPVPEREEVTGMIYLEEDGTLHWIDDFDHAGDDMSFEKE